MSHNPYDLLPEAPAFTLTSTSVTEGGRLATPQVSGVFGAGGEDRLPQLRWSGAPEGTKSYVLTCYDPDAPTVSGFWHLAAYNIPASTTELAEGAITAAGGEGLAEGVVILPNDGGVEGFIGAAPPPGHGDHRYIFVVQALDVETLDLDPPVSPALLHFQLLGHVIGRASLTAYYGR